VNKIIVSACLTGQNCRYDGGNCLDEKVNSFLSDKEIIAVCPEELGGLPTPRDPCERIGNKVLNNKGTEVTEQFNIGAQAALAKAEENQCGIAFMKSGSPSCGKGWIYDGSFTGKKVAGNGVTTELLLANNIEVISDEEI